MTAFLSDPPLPPALAKAAGIYVYRTAAGDACYLKARFDTPKGKRFEQWHVAEGSWAVGKYPGPRPLWDLPALLAAPAAPVLLVEGEKTAAAAAQYLPPGWCVTTWGGSSEMSAADWTPLADRSTVLIWPDYDLKVDDAGKRLPPAKQPGYKAALTIRKTLPQAQILTFPPWVIVTNIDGWDLAEHLPENVAPADVTEWILSAIPRNDVATVASLPRSAKPLNGHHKPPSLSLDGIELIRGGAKGDGPPKPILANVVSLLRGSQGFFTLSYDDFSQRAYRAGAPLTDVDFIDVTNWVQRAGIHADVRTVTNAVILVAQECRFHQVKDYLDKLEWDGEPRLDSLLVQYGGAPDTPIVHAMTRRWHIQAAARIYEPGCQADAMLILEGDQGLRKSGYFGAIGKPWFADHISDIGSKDAMQELRGVWLLEFAELDQMGRVDAGRLKGFLTQRVDHYRESYGRIVREYPRSCVFSGTINPGGYGYLKDETGARRFWPVEITKEIDVAAVLAKRDQIWAEAVFRYKDGEAWYLDTQPLRDSARKVQDERYEGDIWDDLVREYLVDKTEVRTTEVLVNAISSSEKARWTRAEQMRVGKILRHFGWKRGKPTNQSSGWAYHRPKEPQQS